MLKQIKMEIWRVQQIDQDRQLATRQEASIGTLHRLPINCTTKGIVKGS